jgi:hypothetical protein
MHVGRSRSTLALKVNDLDLKLPAKAFDDLILDRIAIQFGAIAGSFGQVISRLLDGYDYVIKDDQETIEIVVFGRRGEVPILPPPTKDPPTNGILSRWR